MQYYQEITLLPDADISLNFLWTKIFTQLHIAFADRKNHTGVMDLAVSFPRYGEQTLGDKLRLIADSPEILDDFGVSHVLARYEDYVHMTKVRPVHENRIHGWAVYSRWQPKGALPRRARRYARRHDDTTYEEAMKLLKQKKGKGPYPPYIKMRSLTTGQTFSLFIRKEAVETNTTGSIGTYGLSRDHAVPEF